jgi:protein-S-isoprenylcysteine O-methyltransferase Ste14
MKATRFEYQFRFILHAIIFILGFTAPWVARNSYASRSAWIEIAAIFAHHGWLSFFAAVDVILSVALLFLALGAAFRVWGAAYVGADIVASRGMHASVLLADGPYRRTRNPLYLGSILHTIGISILMPVSGAIFCIALIWIFQFRLALAEEPFLADKFGPPYLDYKARVPRFLPSPTPLVPDARKHPRWLFAVLGEFYFVAVVVVLGIWGWQFNAQPILRGVLISLGVWLVIYAFLPRAKAEPATVLR